MRNKYIANSKSSSIIFNKILLLQFKNNKLKGSHYRSVSMDPLGSAEQTLGTTDLSAI